MRSVGDAVGRRCSRLVTLSVGDAVGQPVGAAPPGPRPQGISCYRQHMAPRRRSPLNESPRASWRYLVPLVSPPFQSEVSAAPLDGKPCDTESESSSTFGWLAQELSSQDVPPLLPNKQNQPQPNSQQTCHYPTSAPFNAEIDLEDEQNPSQRAYPLRDGYGGTPSLSPSLSLPIIVLPPPFRAALS